MSGEFTLFGNNRESSLCATIIPNELCSMKNQQEKESAMEPSSERAELLYDLIRRSREGDMDAMGAVFEQFKAPVFGIAYRYTYDSAAAEDLLQEIFIKVFTHLQNLGQEEAFAGWLYRIAVNTCMSYFRQKKKLLQKTVSLNEVEGLLYEKRDHSQENEMSQPLEDAIQSLPSGLKSVFLLHDVQGFKHEEIAEILECSVGTSKSQLFKARMKIRKQLKSRQIL